MKKLLASTAAVIALFAGRASATETLDPKYFAADESSIMIEEITGGAQFNGEKGGTLPGSGPVIPVPGQLPQPPSGPQMAPSENSDGNIDFTNVNSTLGALDMVVNLMEKIFAIIEKNQPVVNITTNYANAVPFGTTHWTQLQGWSRPGTRKYSFSMKNVYGMEVVKVIYQVHYTYNGNFKGQGRFLTGVTIEPLSVTTAWGYKVSLVSEVPDSTIANVGSHEVPVASMQLQLRWTVHTVVKDVTAKAVYYVQGDGLLREIGTPFRNASERKNREQIAAVTELISNARFN